MNGSIDMPDQVHRLAIRQLDGVLTDDERAELVALLREDAAARRAYLEHMQDTVSLRWILSGHYDRRTALAIAERGPESVRDSRRRMMGWTLLALAAGIACVAALPSWLASRTAETAN